MYWELWAPLTVTRGPGCDRHDPAAWPCTACGVPATRPAVSNSPRVVRLQKRDLARTITAPPLLSCPEEFRPLHRSGQSGRRALAQKRDARACTIATVCVEPRRRGITTTSSREELDHEGPCRRARRRALFDAPLPVGRVDQEQARLLEDLRVRKTGGPLHVRVEERLPGAGGGLLEGGHQVGPVPGAAPAPGAPPQGAEEIAQVARAAARLADAHVPGEGDQGPGAVERRPRAPAGLLQARGQAARVRHVLGEAASELRRGHPDRGVGRVLREPLLEPLRPRVVRGAERPAVPVVEDLARQEV